MAQVYEVLADQWARQAARAANELGALALDDPSRESPQSSDAMSVSAC